MTIPFYNYKKLYLKDRRNYLKIIDKSLETGQFILGDELTKFEKKLSNYLNCKYVVGVSNATSAMEIGLLSLDNIHKKTEIIVPSHSFVATIDAIHKSGFTPRIIDIDSNGLIDVNKIEKAINMKTFGIMAVNLNGMSCDYGALKKIINKHKINLFEDNAQGFGAQFKGKFAGTFGIFSAFSFYPTKILGCFGDGGAIVTNNFKLFNKAKRYRNHGRDEKGAILSWGINSRLDNMQAAILNHNLKRININIKKRVFLSNIFYNKTKNNPNINFHIRNNLNDNYLDVFQNLEIQVDNRRNLIKFLNKNKIQTLIQWKGVTLDKLPLKNIKVEKLINTNIFFNKCLCIPLSDSVNKDEIIYIADKINAFYKINEKKY